MAAYWGRPVLSQRRGLRVLLFFDRAKPCFTPVAAHLVHVLLASLLRSCAPDVARCILLPKKNFGCFTPVASHLVACASSARPRIHGVDQHPGLQMAPPSPDHAHIAWWWGGHLNQ